MAQDPRPTTDLSDAAAYPFEDGADEIVLRVSRYGENGQPASYQAIVRGKDRTRVWGVGVRGNPVSALERAIACFYEPKYAERLAAGEDPNAVVAAQERAIKQGESVDQEPSEEIDEIDDLLS